MSRVGRRPITIPEKVKLSYENRELEVKGPRGTLAFSVSGTVELEIQDKILKVLADYENNTEAKTLMGTTQATITNMIIGVTDGFKKQLNLVGVGYRASVKGSELELNLGFSHPIIFKLPEGVSATVTANTQIYLESCDKQLLGQTAAEIRHFRPPEPYKGKGVLFSGEKLRRKVGKSGKK
ncbi:50S ribosomal protein L6 [Deltaproteobacteria bacterium TL4]